MGDSALPAQYPLPSLLSRKQLHLTDTALVGLSSSWACFSVTRVFPWNLYIEQRDRRASQVALVVKKLPANAGNIRDVGSIPGLGRSPGGSSRTATHSSILAWRIPWTEEPGGLQPIGSQRVRHD